MKNLGFAILFAFLASGCGSQIEDFVRKEPLKGVGDIPSVISASGVGVKLSPGANQVSGANLKARVAITPTSRVLSGTQVKATVTVSQSRAQ